MEPINARKNHMDSIRASLQVNPIMNKNTAIIEAKIEKRKKRKQSLNLDQRQQLTESQYRILNEDDSSVKAVSKFYEKYEMGAKIGQGSNGLVRKCYHKQTNQLLAVKTMMMDDEHIIFLKQNFREIRQLNNPHIIKFRAMFLDLRKHVCYLVMDYQPLPDLNLFKDLSQFEIKNIMYQLIDTLAYLHRIGICHRDIKPDNILYDRVKQNIKIIDFGISKKIRIRNKQKDMLTITGTLYYRAPQMFLGGGYDQKVDIWAAGITLYYLIAQKTPFESQYHSQTIDKIEKGIVIFGEQWNKYSKFAKDLVLRLLKTVDTRLAALQAKRHLWFSQQYITQIDISKSDNLTLKFASKLSTKYHEDAQLLFQRSLSNQKQKLSLELEELKEQDNKNKLQVNSLKKWLTGSDDQDCLIQIDSEGELQKQSPLVSKAEYKKW